MIEVSTSGLNASEGIVDLCMVRIGEQGMHPGFSVQGRVK